ncbi:protein Kti12p [[Candida] anglica]|uniref:Protein Kti12p n=1 Tax=[Candida] anglica TaxID=148631 RepID=A0ABP0EEI5_9ASCO
MPLITFTGPPSSGKTRWARKLEAALREKIDEAKQSGEQGGNYSVIYHSDETLGIAHSNYKDSTLEKHARGTQMAAVKRDLSRNNFVILDTMAYIKGFRYQLYCEAKGIVTPHCVVQVMTPLDKCIEWNAEAGSPWDEELIRQLGMRYEEPNDSSRWDSPLFTLVSDYAEEKLPIQELWNCLVLKQAPPPNAATVVKATSGNGFLQELDTQTSAVVSKIVQHQQLISVGGEVLISRGEPSLVVEMPSTSVSIAQLQRIRRTYVSLNRMRNVDIDRITPLFVDYLNRSLAE